MAESGEIAAWWLLIVSRHSINQHRSPPYLTKQIAVLNSHEHRLEVRSSLKRHYSCFHLVMVDIGSLIKSVALS